MSISLEEFNRATFQIVKPHLVETVKQLLPFPNTWDPTDDELEKVCMIMCKVYEEMSDGWSPDV